MILTLDSPATQLVSFGEKLKAPLHRLGIQTVRDLLGYYPIRHEDYRHRSAIVDVKIGAKALVAGRLTALGNRRSWQKHMVVTEAMVEDGTGTLHCIWFRQPYIAHQFHVGDEVVVSGTLRENRYGAAMIAPTLEKVGQKELIHTSGLVAQYPLTRGLSQRQLRYLLYRALGFTAELTDWIPSILRQQHDLLDCSTATRSIHTPPSEELLDRAKWRLGFEELFRFQCQAQIVKSQHRAQRAPAITFDQDWFSTVVHTLPFPLTQDQRKATWAMIQEMRSSLPMNRLLIGDVGTGKTLVAALALAAVAKAGYQAVLLAPTELLALQHFETLIRLLGKSINPLCLFTRSYQQRHHGGSNTALSARTLKAFLKKGAPGIIVGTHSLISQSVQIPRLALVVVDEQHRFGVQQRRLMLAKGSGAAVHHLSMTATPIPRTFALAFFADLDCSYLNQFPGGRRTVTTEIVDPDDRSALRSRVEDALKRKEGIYVIAPRIGDHESSGKASVMRLHKEFENLFPQVRWGMLHGRMRSLEQREAMVEFQRGELAGLISTTVVEVGVDVGHATVLIVEHAEQFGLSQLHQLRGRVGRKGQAARCILVPSVEADQEAYERLQVLVDHHDGASIAESDLELRGPGVFLGVAQSGEARFRFASLKNQKLVQAAHSAAMELLKQDPTLEHFPFVREQLYK
ncbi:ATP-dependent DNA helicase RecG [Candidatus Uhrbacteria bacterium]|nr:ATP-dependent DNA helicase RecG [Candidatus Uhrbacteria bacterium]